MKNAITMIAIMLIAVVLTISCGDDGNDEKKVVNDGSESCDTSGIYRCNGTQPEVCGIAYWKNSMKLTWNTSVDGNTQLKDCAEYGDDYVCELTESVIGTTIAECKKVDNNDDQNFDDFDVVEIKDDDDSVADDSDIDTDDTKASSWTAIAAGNYHTCGIRTDDKLYCWGYNIIGQLGNGTSGIISDMYIIPTKTGDDSWSAIVAGGDHTCGIRKSDSKLYCWGRNDYGEIGDGTEEAKNIPIKIGDDRWLAIAAGSNHTCGIKSDSTLYCWGKNVYGQLGDETDGYGTEKLVPTKIGNDTWSAITVGADHTCGIKATDSKLYCWGNNSKGQLGDGTDGTSCNSPHTCADKNIPTKIGDDTWSVITAGEGYSCGIRTDNKPYCWGFNFNGQLGNGIFGNDCPDEYGEPGPCAYENTPIRLSDDTWIAITAGNRRTCGMKSDNKLYCWGVTANIPTEISEDVWLAIAIGGDYICGIKMTDNNLYCWGANNEGQLGTGDTAEKSTPTLVADPL